MPSNNLVEKKSIGYMNQILERAIIDVEFRTELLSRPEEFGMTEEDVKNLTLLKSVEAQDISFVELVNDTDMLARPRCGSTCVSGFTYVCDGNTHPSCRRTCVSGFTIRCDGATV